MQTSPTVLVVGSGISGLACARALHDGGVGVRVVDRGRVVGGRLATKRVDDRPVDTGARYFTVPEASDFALVVDDWLARGLAREWTDTFTAIAADGARSTKTGPMRYAAPAGLRSLATDLAERLRADGVTIDQQVTVDQVSGDGVADGTRYETVVLAMPDPQAKRMLAPGSPAAATLQAPDQWNPTLAVTLAYPTRLWPTDFHGAFVDNSAIVSFIADDGDRRGDGAPVLVAHSTPAFAREHLENPESGIAAVTEAVGGVLGFDERPRFAGAHRWTYSNPVQQHPEPFLREGGVAVCGDAWGERSAVSTAWASGAALGRAIAGARAE